MAAYRALPASSMLCTSSSIEWLIRELNVHLGGQINAAKHIVLERQTITYKNTGSKPVQEILVCHPAEQTPDRAFFEVRSASGQS